MEPTLRIYMLGPPRIVRGQETIYISSRKGEALIYFVALQGVPVQRQELAGLLWPDSTDGAAGSLLRTLLTQLRTQFAETIDISRYTVAVSKMQGVWADARQLQRVMEDDGDVHAWEEALALYRNHFLQGFAVGSSDDFENWQLQQRRQLYLAANRGYQRVVEHYIASSQLLTARRFAWKWVGLFPLSDLAQEALIKLLAQTGLRAEALQQYEHYRTLLRREMGISPSAAAQAIAARIRGKLPPE